MNPVSDISCSNKLWQAYGDPQHRRCSHILHTVPTNLNRRQWTATRNTATVLGSAKQNTRSSCIGQSSLRAQQQRAQRQEAYRFLRNKRRVQCRAAGRAKDAFEERQPFQSWTSKCGRWLIRPIRREDLKSVAHLQANAFHKPLHIGPLDALGLYVFQGEVLGSLQQKLKYSHKTGFICLVAEHARGSSALAESRVVGAVELSLQAEKEEMAALSTFGLQDTTYAYIACMAVAPLSRRQGVASALLAAAERMAGRWQQNWVLLHSHRDATGGLDTYKANGYVELAGQPWWRTWLQGEERVLLGKQASQFSQFSSPGSVQSLSSNLLALWQQQKGGLA